MACRICCDGGVLSARTTDSQSEKAERAGRRRREAVVLPLRTQRFTEVGKPWIARPKNGLFYHDRFGGEDLSTSQTHETHELFVGEVRKSETRAETAISREGAKPRRRYLPGQRRQSGKTQGREVRNGDQEESDREAKDRK